MVNSRHEHLAGGTCQRVAKWLADAYLLIWQEGYAVDNWDGGFGNGTVATAFSSGEPFPVNNAPSVSLGAGDRATVIPGAAAPQPAQIATRNNTRMRSSRQERSAEFDVVHWFNGIRLVDQSAANKNRLINTIDLAALTVPNLPRHNQRI